MGLKAKNYVINGYEYPEVYAVFNGNIKKLGNDYQVSFNIHATRELALTNKPLQEKHIRVQWDRHSDIVQLAYEQGKKPKLIQKWNDEKKMLENVFVDGVFTNWEDDIQRLDFYNNNY